MEGAKEVPLGSVRFSFARQLEAAQPQVARRDPIAAIRARKTRTARAPCCRRKGCEGAPDQGAEGPKGVPGHPSSERFRPLGRVAGRPRLRVLYNEDPFLSLPARTGRQPHQSGWGEDAFFPVSAFIGAMRAYHADLQRKSDASSPMPGMSSAANEVATTPE
jgi:hypothetical protein